MRALELFGNFDGNGSANEFESFFAYCDNDFWLVEVGWIFYDSPVTEK